MPNFRFSAFKDVMLLQLKTMRQPNYLHSVLTIWEWQLVIFGLCPNVYSSITFPRIHTCFYSHPNSSPERKKINKSPNTKHLKVCQPWMWPKSSVNTVSTTEILQSFSTLKLSGQTIICKSKSRIKWGPTQNRIGSYTGHKKQSIYRVFALYFLPSILLWNKFQYSSHILNVKVFSFHLKQNLNPYLHT